MKIEVDTKALEELARDIEKFKREALFKLVESGAEYMREEVPKDTHRLESGVSSFVNYGENTKRLSGKNEINTPSLAAMSGEIIVSAESDRRGARTATLHLKDGKTKEVKLRPTNAYNYAEVVARGNKDATLSPKTAKAFLIPVTTFGPIKGEFLEANGERFVVRTSRKGQKANPYHERAAKRLSNDAVNILAAAAEEFFQ